MLLGGAAWVVFISLINAMVQNLAPDWVRARVLAIFILAYQGAFALGSAIWGAIAQRAGIHVALMYAGVGTAATTTLALFARLPDSPADLSVWNHWRMPVVVKEIGDDLQRGPVMVTVEYVVPQEREAGFLEAIHKYGRMRRRDGAYRWGVFRDTAVADHYLEVYMVNSWAEHMRQHERQTKADRQLEEQLRGYAATEPKVRHLIYSHSKDD